VYGLRDPENCMRNLSCVKRFWEIIRESSPEVFELRKTSSVTEGSLKCYSVEAITCRSSRRSTIMSYSPVNPKITGVGVEVD
jgi:hypothetical protein